MINATPLAVWRKAWLILTPPQRRSAVVLFVLQLTGMLLEMLSLGLVVPALVFMATDDPGARSPRLSAILDHLGNPSRDQLVVGGVALLLVVAAVKSAFFVYLAWRQSMLSASVHTTLGQRLYSLYLTQPWTFHLQRNSAQLIRNAGFECGQFTSVVSSFTCMCADMLVTTGIALMLLVLQPVGTLIAGAVLATSVFLLQRFTKPAVVRWGAARQHHELKKLQHLQQGLGGVKDVKILGRESLLIDQFQAHNAVHAHVQQRQLLVGQLPRLWYELVAVTGLCVLSITMVLLDTPASRFVPTLGVFAAAAFKLLPSMNRLALNLQAVWFASPVVNTLFAELSLPAAPPMAEQAAKFNFAKVLELTRVSFRYPNAESDAIQDITLRIPRGSSVGIIGESGAGKSTLVDVLLGLLAPSSGAVTVDGVDVTRDPRSWQRLIGYVPQSIFLSDDTLRNNVAFGVPEARIDDEAVVRSLRAAKLDDFVASLPDGMHTFVGERGIRMSGGQRQRVGIARALYHNPSVLMLDEATSALDSDTERGVMGAVNALHGDKTLIIVAHRLSTVANCDRIYRLHKGHLVESGTFSAVTSTAGN